MATATRSRSRGTRKAARKPAKPKLILPAGCEHCHADTRTTCDRACSRRGIMHELERLGFGTFSLSYSGDGKYLVFLDADLDVVELDETTRKPLEVQLLAGLRKLAGSVSQCANMVERGIAFAKRQAKSPE
jgi:hypothetical protein